MSYAVAVAKLHMRAISDGNKPSRNADLYVVGSLAGLPRDHERREQQTYLLERQLSRGR